MASYFGAPGATNEWYTPKYLFDAMAVEFDLDVAAARLAKGHVPARRFEWADGLKLDWSKYGFVFMNPPFGSRNGLIPWLDKFFAHGNGVCLVPDRTSAPWWQAAARRADLVLFIAGKVKFIRPGGTTGNSPGDGTCLMAIGAQGRQALTNAAKADLGVLFR